MADDQMTLPMFAGVIDLLQKQEIGPSSAEGDTCEHGCYALCIVHGSPLSRGMMGFRGMTTSNEPGFPQG